MITEKPIFGLKVRNIAIINIRREFATYLAALSDPEFVHQLGMVGAPIDLPLLTWKDLPLGLLTFMLQRSILGLESCVSAAVEFQLDKRGLFTSQMATAMNNPARLPPECRRGMAEAFYNKLPALIDHNLQLDVMEPALWETIRQFYKDIRNPLFHGYQLGNVNVPGTLEALQMLERVYSWIDGWSGQFTIVVPRAGFALMAEEAGEEIE